MKIKLIGLFICFSIYSKAGHIIVTYNNGYSKDYSTPAAVDMEVEDKGNYWEVYNWSLTWPTHIFAYTQYKEVSNQIHNDCSYKPIVKSNYYVVIYYVWLELPKNIFTNVKSKY